MKANEAPEKIYVHVRYKPCEITFSEVKEEGVSNVEYTRTDVFIEKACQWLYDNLHWADPSDFLEDFKTSLQYD